ncbi:hypothetical protein DEIPH_ctg012orf0082 [Deinococcus phoenicis]|uniref:Aminoglycoside phosphotransferase domain-containing protein n=1 Tax=Deinococcus phoenicis TaxID=1476583 RepID=A0A016QSH6_9DEIO|nr:phosphotransferase [Deinococcus phoenicis]EYB69013.1 hypothetical protein DEIPH_ctg012orf0082 [Deinococcus phoenicis]
MAFPRRETALHLLFLHPDGARVALQTVTVTTPTYYGQHVLEAAPPGTRLLRRLHFRALGEAEGVLRAETVWQLHTDAPEGLDWQPLDALTGPGRDWAGAARLPATPRRAPWMHPDWQAGALAWLDAELGAQGRTRLGEPTVLKHWQISLLWQVETTGGRVYFKAVPDFFGREVQVTPRLAAELPGAAPPVLAADEERGFLLLREAGQTQEAPDLPALMRHLAWVQRRSLPLLPRLPLQDRSPGLLLARLDDLFSDACLRPGEEGGLTADEAAALRARRPELEAALKHLDASPLPLTLGHGDLHGGNVVVDGAGRFTVLDWSDACRIHPFLDANAAYLSAAPAGAVEEAHTAYLSAWTDLLPLENLRALHADALQVGELLRALGYVDGIQPHVEDPAEWHGAHLYHLRKLLEG